MLPASAPHKLEDQKSPKDQEEHASHGCTQYRPGELGGGGRWWEQE